MEYIEYNYAPLAILAIGFVSKKLMKKELVPVSGWKQILTTYITLSAGVAIADVVKKEVNKNRTVPKPN